MPMVKRSGVLFIGEDPIISELTGIMAGHRPRSYEIVGPWSKKDIVLPNNNFMELIDQHNIKMIINQNTSDISQQLSESLVKIRLKKFNVYDASSYYQKITGKLPVHHVDEDILISMSQRKFFSSRIIASIKRAVDIIFTLLLLPWAVPLIILCAIAIKLDSKGPVFFIQERLGIDGVPFKLIKLRTMVDKAEKNVPQWCKDNDPRITRVGKILRKLRLDELPQLFNVLKNEMSLVGPRPIRQYFTDMLAMEVPFYRLRLLAKPGLTGWAQVHAGHANTIEAHVQMLQFDLYYLIHQSFWLDLIILVRTVRTILLGLGR